MSVGKLLALNQIIVSFQQYDMVLVITQTCNLYHYTIA